MSRASEQIYYSVLMRVCSYAHVQNDGRVNQKHHLKNRCGHDLIASKQQKWQQNKMLQPLNLLPLLQLPAPALPGEGKDGK